MSDDRTEIIDFVNEIFAAVDAKDWDGAKKLFESTVTADFTSLNGGEPGKVASAELVDGWRKGLRDGQDSSFHLVGNHRVDINGDIAIVVLKGYAYNLAAPEFGGGLWEAWGTYEVLVRRAPTGWLVTGMSFFASHTRGGT
jgi:hypothetical protein